MNLYNSIQGNLGLGKAIEYFTSQGMTVAIPLNDTQKYDLVVDFNNKLQRISVKTSRYKKPSGNYEVLLKNCGGSSKEGKIRPFDNTTCDYLFIYAANEKIYLIPSSDILVSSTLTLCDKYKQYEIKIKTLQDFDEEVRE